MIRIIEFFGGIGAFTQAMKKVGVEFEVVDYVEIDKFAVASYNAMNGRNFEPQDISKWDKDMDVDIIMHGSPCQDFSIAGHNKGGDEGSGTRSSLMYETIRIVSKLKPKVVVWENVKNLLSQKHRHNFDAYCKKMETLGYTNYYSVLDARDYGIPQHRERVFTVSILGEHKPFSFPVKQKRDIRLVDLLEENVAESMFLSEEYHRRFKFCDRSFRKDIVGTTKTESQSIGQREVVFNPYGTVGCLTATDYKQPKRIIDLGSCIQVGQLYGTEKEPNPQAGRVYDPEGSSPSLDTCSGGNRMPKILVKEATKKGYAEAYEGDSVNLEQPNSKTRRGRVGHGTAQTLNTSCNQAVVIPGTNGLRLRKITPKESWRLMGFSDECFDRAKKVNSSTQLYKQAGNSIVVNVLHEIIKRLAVSVDLGIKTEAEELTESTEQVFIQLEFAM